MKDLNTANKNRGICVLMEGTMLQATRDRFDLKTVVIIVLSIMVTVTSIELYVLTHQLCHCAPSQFEVEDNVVTDSA